MFKAFEFCLPTTGAKVPAGPEWLHEIKYDGFRLRVEQDGDRVRLMTRGGHDWTKRYPWITEAARKVRRKRFVLDSEAVILGVDGVSDFNALRVEGRITAAALWRPLSASTRSRFSNTVCWTPAGP
jgi:ATP-dependent DNA ligase